MLDLKVKNTYHIEMRVILLLLTQFFLGNTNFIDAKVYRLDWMMQEAQRQVFFDRTKFQEITGEKFLMVFWQTGSEEFFKMTPELNDLAALLKTQYRLVAYNPGDDYATIKRFKRQLNKDFIQPRKDIETFLSQYTFVVDLDTQLPKGLYQAKAPCAILVENGKVIKMLQTSQEIKKFIEEQKKALIK